MISVIVTVYNEVENVSELHGRLVSVMQNLGQEYEIIFVDDGSDDGTFEELKRLKPIKVYQLPKNYGQTIALACGLDHAKGEIIMTLDGDLENQPEDIPILLDKLDAGYDVVAGWRKSRWSRQLLFRRLPSLIANSLISSMGRVKVHDHGCSLRAYRAHVFKDISFSGEMHRMLPSYLAMQGAKVTEVPVNFESRKFGKSKYGFSRSFKVLLDVLAFYFFRWFSDRPIHFFGYTGFALFALGLFTFLLALFLRIFSGIHFNRTPLPELVAIFVVVGFQFILFGLLAEIIVRLRRKEINLELYDIKEQIKN